MAESSACLVRSFSTPADTCYEGNPLRALGESISFGRFMPEELDWEKWSTFTHNRYVEEAEKYSKPGSVAAKRAYFEAHYKRKAAERAAALIQETNAQVNGTIDEAQEGDCADSSFETSSIVNNVVVANEEQVKETVNCESVDRYQLKSDAVQSDLGISNSDVVIANEEQDKETVNRQVVECVDRNQHTCDAVESDLDISNVEGAEDALQPRVDIYLNVESCTLDSQFHHVEDNKNTAVHADVSALPVKGREAFSPQSTTKTVVANVEPSPVPPRSGINSGPKGKKSVGDSVEKKKLAARSVCVSINLASGTVETHKRMGAASQSRNGLNNFSTSKKSAGGITSKTATKPRNGISISGKSMKSVGDSVFKRPTPSSLHMSINLPSIAGETNKTGSLLEQNRVKSKPLELRTSMKASHVNKSVSGGVTANGKPSSSRTIRSNSQSATISLPFRFRSEERAVKRKEFLQRMDETETKSKEEAKVKLQRTLKGKTEYDYKKLRQSSDSISKINEDRPSGSLSPSNQIRKSSLALPRSPKLGKKASSSIVQGKKKFTEASYQHQQFQTYYYGKN
ncbi:hypothetical protein Fmac_013914 [Flemingia macrophylla]|uniref:TPX2 C-terminal domain-containing protein n=1 Tax=Flemingia macrophylla TaxID=520843 RepID=A0ABD1MAB9_9FABA